MTDPGHLSKFESRLFSGSEWPLSTAHWIVLQLCEGIAYVCCAGTNQELPRGGLLISPPNSPLGILASTLGPATLRGVAVRVNSLAGFLTAVERQCLESHVARRCAPFLLLAPSHALVPRLAELCQNDRALTLANRLGFLHAFAELLSPYLVEAIARHDTGLHDAKARMRQFINQMPESELADLSLGKLAGNLHCCERHASRLFHEVCGCSFRAYVSDLRLRKACSLLANDKLKIIDVALESGHGSLALFNFLFKKRFAMTPTEWRERHLPRERRAPRQRLSALAVAAG